MSTATENDVLRVVERRYMRQGYRVLVHPHGDNVPTFLAPFKPDMLAYNGQESVVVEVKQRADLPAAAYLMDLADAVDAQQGWRLDLAVVNPGNPPLVDGNTKTLKVPEIVSRVRASRQLVEERQEEAAILLAWSAVEATLRLLATREAITLEDDQPGYSIEALYSLGILGREDYATLQHGLQVQAIISHGFRLPEPEPTLAETLIGKVEEMLQMSATDLAM